MIYPIWIDGPWQGEEHGIEAWQVSSGPYIVRTARPEPVQGLTYADWCVNDHLYYFLRLTLFRHIFIVASVVYEISNLRQQEDLLYELIISDRAKKAEQPR